MATVDEAIDALTQLGFPKRQLNERSALVLLALLDLTPNKPWSEATAPLCGITPMMDHMAEHYSKKYAPNSRETVRRQTVHQFLQGGLILQNRSSGLAVVVGDLVPGGCVFHLGSQARTHRDPTGSMSRSL